ncbi:MAG: DUF2087 domain-containing protein [Actinobacteria bacterium]|nr:DUF2087 domain-containing protein [Actinomycetota bacterium]
MELDDLAATLEAARLLAVLADPDRLKIVSALVLGAWSVKDIEIARSLGRKTIEHALSRLVAGDLVDKDRAGYRLRIEELRAAAKAAAGERRAREAGPAGASEVVARFIKGGRLTSMPTVRSKRVAVLDHIAQSFEPGRRYTEKKVNEMLRAYFDDCATLRRSLVDEGLLERDGGKYWRAGGSFPID